MKASFLGDHMKKITFKPIGTIHSPFNDLKGMPIQPPGAKGAAGRVELLPAYEGGLKDLDGFSHVIIVYIFHRASGYILSVKPFMDSQTHGLFATRAPKRPNPIGLSVVKLTRIAGPTLYVENIDVLDGTPLLDVKPYVPEFDHPSGPISTGWLEKAKGLVEEKRSDSRFR
jgi:tRNA-Thr(GGU) m(6)t(6)A37 methyltransferase TsaA